MKSKRQSVREKRQRQKTISRLILGVFGIVLVTVLGYAIWAATRPATGEAIDILPESDHVEEGTDPGPYNSEPPTSGRHYAQDLDPGFYEENDPIAQTPYPEGYLVHNLEHGYVIFWYNCTQLSEGACADLKGQIRSVMSQVNNFKVIAFPRPTLDVPIVMTSWGRLQSFDRFDTSIAKQFVERNRNKAPEPNAP